LQKSHLQCKDEMFSNENIDFVLPLLRMAPIEAYTTKLNVVGPQVRRFREQQGWTQGQLAVKLQLFGWDTSRVSVTKLENQERRVPDLELFVLAKVLGITTDDLFPRNLRGKIKAWWPLYRAKLSRGQVPPE
jgi:DNA-binding XRE family transcriptional regulator